MRWLIGNLVIIAVWSHFANYNQFVVDGTTSKTSELECMFLGYPELEYDGFDRTEVRHYSCS